MKPHGVWSHAWSNGGRWLLVFAVLFSLALGVLATVTVGVIFNDRYSAKQEVFAPLGPDPIQTVLTPVVHNSESVTVQGTKCNHTKQTVAVEGNLVWVAVTPAGFVFRAVTTTGVRAPGCTMFTFIDKMPPEVVAVNQKLFDQGLLQAQWKLTGESIPVDKNGKLGVPSPYHSTEFTVIP